MFDDSKVFGALNAENECAEDERENNWDSVARENQKVPPGDWNIWLLLAGRGFGKTRAAAEAVRKFVLEGKCKRIALIGSSIKEAQNVMVEGESGLLSISSPSEKLKYNRTRGQITWPNGAIATIYGAERPEQLRGPQFDFAWIDEIAKFNNPDEVFMQLNFALRLGEYPKTIITTTPRPIRLLKELIQREDVHVTRGASIENKANLSKNFLSQLEYMKGTALEAQELYGEIVEENEYGLWTFDDISRAYKKPCCDFEKIIVAIDPSMKADPPHDETGIIVCGLDELGTAYIIDDLSVCAPPDEWARAAVNAYNEYNAEYIAYEANQGGDLVRSMLRGVDPGVNTKGVFSHLSKHARAIPVRDLYLEGKIFHMRQLRQLENQMLSFPKGKDDRIDALVIGIRDLLMKNEYRPAGFWMLPG